MNCCSELGLDVQRSSSDLYDEYAGIADESLAGGSLGERVWD